MGSSGAVGVTAGGPLAICLPWAGGSAQSYRVWSGANLGRVEVIGIEYPGHGTRVGEAPMVSIGDIAADAFQRSAALASGRRVVLVGHSMGALVAFELCMRLQREGIIVAGLVVSSMRGPDSGRPPEGADLSESGLLRQLSALGGSPPELLAHREFISLLLPILRADLEAVLAYRWPTLPALDADLLLMWGRDEAAAHRASIRSWRSVVRPPHASCIQSFSGGHFYLVQESDTAVITSIACFAEGGPFTSSGSRSASMSSIRRGGVALRGGPAHVA
jgi:medium-chain acyl-[acyl-carrier-protein] hydrolase